MTPSSDTSYLSYYQSVRGIGRRSILKIIEFQQRQQIGYQDFFNTPIYWQAAGLNQAQRSSLKRFQQRFDLASYQELLASKGIKVISYHHYPQLLSQIDDFPIVLFVKNPSALLKPRINIAIVGSRDMSSYGGRATKKIVQELSQWPVNIVSGFMYGVDYHAHCYALQFGLSTIGVLAYGFDHCYPSYFQSKRAQFLDQGMCFITEFPPFAPPRKMNFVSRNRIIAGLSLATLVVEAKAKSGSLITAQFALDYGREVMTIPGSIFSQVSDGVRDLLNQGALGIGHGHEIIDNLPKPVFNHGQLVTDGDMTSFASCV